MKRLTDLLHENRRLRQEKRLAEERSKFLYDALTALDKAFCAYRREHGCA